MKRLIIAETPMVAIAIVVVLLGNIIGWSKEATFFVVAAVFGIILVISLIATLRGANVTGATSTSIDIFGTIAATFAFVTTFITAIANVFVALFSIIILAGITASIVDLAISVFTSTKMLKYRWVFSSLLIEGVAIWAILTFL